MLTIHRDDLRAALELDELPAETAAVVERVLSEARFEMIVLNREGHPPPFELSRFDMAQVEGALRRIGAIA